MDVLQQFDDFQSQLDSTGTTTIITPTAFLQKPFFLITKISLPKYIPYKDKSTGGVFVRPLHWNKLSYNLLYHFQNVKNIIFIDLLSHWGNLFKAMLLLGVLT